MVKRPLAKVGGVFVPSAVSVEVEGDNLSHPESGNN